MKKQVKKKQVKKQVKKQTPAKKPSFFSGLDLNQIDPYEGTIEKPQPPTPEEVLANTIQKLAEKIIAKAIHNLADTIRSSFKSIETQLAENQNELCDISANLYSIRESIAFLDRKYKAEMIVQEGFTVNEETYSIDEL